MFLNNTPIRTVCKRQATVESSTCGSELVAARMATESVTEVRHQLRMMGVPLDGPALVLGDNKSVILNTSTPSSVLKKKHCSINFHKVREAMSARILRFSFVRSHENLSDVLTKPLGNVAFHRLVRPLLFRSPQWQEAMDPDQINFEKCLN